MKKFLKQKKMHLWIYHFRTSSIPIPTYFLRQYIVSLWDSFFFIWGTRTMRCEKITKKICFWWSNFSEKNCINTIKTRIVGDQHQVLKYADKRKSKQPFIFSILKLLSWRSVIQLTVGEYNFRHQISIFDTPFLTKFLH